MTREVFGEVRTRAEECDRRLSRPLEDCRRAGAPPGWLRGGTELEPPKAPASSAAGQRRSDDPWEQRIQLQYGVL